MYSGPTDICPWGTTVAGEVSNNEKWLINPAQCEEYENEKRQETVRAVRNFDLSTPTGPADSLHPGGHSPRQQLDVDISLLADLGKAITRTLQGL